MQQTQQLDFKELKEAASLWTLKFLIEPEWTDRSEWESINDLSVEHWPLLTDDRIEKTFQLWMGWQVISSALVLHWTIHNLTQLTILRYSLILQKIFFKALLQPCFVHMTNCKLNYILKISQFIVKYAYTNMQMSCLTNPGGHHSTFNSTTTPLIR